MYGTPVIGARIGGIPELIGEEETGLLFAPGNVEDLETKIRYLWDTRGLAEGVAKNCVQRKFETADSYYQKLIEIYGSKYENL